MVNEEHPTIAAVVVNHNTSAFAELMLRSLFATHPTLPNFSVRVFDHSSTDDMDALRDYAAQKGLPIHVSGFGINTLHNSHGDGLSRFVADTPHCDYFLFLDADVVFMQRETIATMLCELQADESAFGAGVRLSWDGVATNPELYENPDVYAARLHPCCALVKNSALFRGVVAEVGLFCAKWLWAEREEYLDTFRAPSSRRLSCGIFLGFL